MTQNQRRLGLPWNMLWRLNKRTSSPEKLKPSSKVPNWRLLNMKRKRRKKKLKRQNRKQKKPRKNLRRLKRLWRKLFLWKLRSRLQNKKRPPKKFKMKLLWPSKSLNQKTQMKRLREFSQTAEASILLPLRMPKPTSLQKMKKFQDWLWTFSSMLDPDIRIKRARLILFAEHSKMRKTPDWKKLLISKRERIRS